MDYDYEEVPLIYKKRLETRLNKVIIPKEAVDKLGRYYSLQVYKDKIVLLPITEEDFYDSKRQ